jgi:hypothetical protein
VSAAWKAIPESIIVRNKDDSDLVTDNDSVMSDDGESDELQILCNIVNNK